MRCAVKSVAKHFPTAIISGRRRDMVDGLCFLSSIMALNNEYLVLVACTFIVFCCEKYRITDS